MTTVPVEVRRGPGRPRSANRDEAIVAAAIDELVANGYAGMSIEGVAARAGVAKTTVYRRWAGKDDLVLAALSKVKGPLPEPPGTSVRADLTYILEQMRTSWLDSTHGRLMQRLAADGYARPELYRRFRDQGRLAPDGLVLGYGMITEDRVVPGLRELIACLRAASHFPARRG
jgi:AcrR family transcriptional regulator